VVLPPKPKAVEIVIDKKEEEDRLKKIKQREKRRQEIDEQKKMMEDALRQHIISKRDQRASIRAENEILE
jgi:hypothetical protein